MALDGDVEIGSMYYFQIDAPMQMSICKSIFSLDFLIMADYTGKKPNQILVGFTAYNCRMVINKDDPSAIKDFSFISDGKTQVQAHRLK